MMFEVWCSFYLQVGLDKLVWKDCLMWHPINKGPTLRTFQSHKMELVINGLKDPIGSHWSSWWIVSNGKLWSMTWRTSLQNISTSYHHWLVSREICQLVWESVCPGRDGKIWQQQHMLDEWVFHPARMSKVPNQLGWTEALAANWGWSAFLINRTSVKCFWIFQKLLILLDPLVTFFWRFRVFSESNWFLHVVSPFKMVLHVWKAIYCNYEETGTNSGSWPSAHSARRVKLLGAVHLPWTPRATHSLHRWDWLGRSQMVTPQCCIACFIVPSNKAEMSCYFIAWCRSW